MGKEIKINCGVSMETTTKDRRQEIKDFLLEMTTQDNHATALPFFYVIRDLVIVGSCNHDSGANAEKTQDAYFEEDGNEVDEDEWDEETGYKRTTMLSWMDFRLFLTESDAKQHLEANRHRYTEKAHIYVKHIWRAPHLENFLNNLCKEYLGKETLEEAWNERRSDGTKK